MSERHRAAKNPYSAVQMPKPLDFVKLGEPACCQYKGLEELWFSENEHEQKWAKRVCLGSYLDGLEPCEIRFECLQAALDNNIKFGIWGGLTPNQRTRADKK